jgi:hypothetical protein
MSVSVHTVQRMEKQAVITNFERRQFLVAFLGIPAAYLQLDTDTQEQWAEHTVLLYNDDPMSFVEDMVNARWATFGMGGPRHTVRGLSRLVKAVESFVQGASERGWHRRAQTQLCIVYHLRALVEGDLLHHHQSLAWQQKAYAVAAELNDAELMAAAREGEGITFLPPLTQQ